jgi:uncharacterized protein (DUF302 family)
MNIPDHTTDNYYIMDKKGIVKTVSPYPVKETIDRIVVFLQAHGGTLYTRIDQQSELRHVGKEIRPLEFILFGNPKAGGAVMEANPMAALELPLKVIAWEDAEGKTWLAYNEAEYIGDRYELPLPLLQPLDLHPLIAKALA